MTENVRIDDNMVEFDKEKYHRLRTRVLKLHENGAKKDFVFTFDGHALRLDYAGYVVAYLKERFEQPE